MFWGWGWSFFFLSRFFPHHWLSFWFRLNVLFFFFRDFLKSFIKIVLFILIDSFLRSDIAFW